MKLVIVGCGLIGSKRAAGSKGHSIAAVCDVDGEKAAALAAKTQAVPFTDWREALKVDADAVVIATSHDTLSEIALHAVNAGRHVLIEKPAGRDAAELRRVADAAKQKNCIAKVGFNHRFHPAIMKAKQLLDEGAVGPAMFVRAAYGHGGRPGYAQEWRFKREISGGGELVDQGSHLIDLSRWFLGDLKVEYGAVPNYFWGGEVEDNCFLALRGEQSRMAWLHASWTEWKNRFVLEIMGRDGKLMIDGLGGSYGTERLTYYKMLPQMGPPDITTWDFPAPDQSFADEIKNFTDAIEGRVKAIGTIDDAIASLEIVEAVYRQASTRNAQ